MITIYFKMNKICTDISQSQKLIGLGIDINTADMFWDMAEPDKRRKPLVGPISDYADMEDWAVPAWSLSTLISMLPKSARLEKGSSTELCRVNLPVELKCSDWYLDPMDAVFEAYCLLKE